uniref:Uncharacterized protein n=1 Tax=Acrobeloides nanus TaxID=290746 RepID=A0A914DNS1_9BILA
MDSNNAMSLMNTETEMQQEGMPGQNMRVKRNGYWQNRYRYNNNGCVRKCGYRYGRHYCNNCYHRQNNNGYRAIVVY